MVYNTQDYCFFFTYPSSGILETRKHDVSETGSVPQVSSPPFHLRTERGPVSETSCFLVSRIPDDGKVQKPSNPNIFGDQVVHMIFRSVTSRHEPDKTD
jgi:hypothetical protein